MTSEESAHFELNNKALNSVFETWNYRVNFPNQLELTFDSTSVTDEVTINTVYNGGHYWVRSFEDKSNYYHSDSLDLIQFNLDYSQRTFAQENFVTLVQVRPLSAKGYPGRDYKFTFNDSEHISLRQVYMVFNRVYELGFTGPGESLYDIELDNFFNSFQLQRVPQNSIPYLNLPTNEQLENPPFSVNYFGETTRRVEIVETYNGQQAPIITEMNEINSVDGSGLLLLSVAYIILPEESVEAGFEFYVDNSIRSMQQLEPNMKILSEERRDNRADIRMIRVLNEEKCIHNMRYILDGNIYYGIGSVSIYNAPQDDRIEAFFDSFVIK
jgi:hypothetical protein